ncbi:MAG: hypothetical protein L0216_16110 [Planctomycetales bacterium]|nr:hypothetical protein [Planctomycetales bacterium]
MAVLLADEARRRARRALLRLAAYAVPAVLGTFAVARSVEAHSNQPDTKKHCLPCTPHGGPGCLPPCAP